LTSQRHRRQARRQRIRIGQVRSGGAAMHVIRRGVVIASLALLGACNGGGDGGSIHTGPSSSSGGSDVFVDGVVYSGDANASPANPQETASVTHHSLLLNGQTINYTATAGHLTAMSSGGQPEASFFYVAYTQDGQAAAQRPVTFFYNGGPGSAT